MRTRRGLMPLTAVALTVALAAALGVLVVPRVGFAQSEEIEPDGGAAAEEGPAGGPPAPASIPTPAARPETQGTAQAKAVSPTPSENDWDFEFKAGAVRPTKPAHPRRTKLAAALSFIPFVVAGALSAGVIGLAALKQQDLSLGQGDEPPDEEERKQNDERSRDAARRATLAVVPITGALAALPCSLMVASSWSKERIEPPIFGAAFLGSALGLVLDIGLMCALYFTTDSTAAVVVPSIVGLVVLPPIGGAIGGYLAGRAGRSSGVALLPPAPTALAAAGGRAAPAIAFRGVF